ncbi:uncharacterized protein LOC111381619 [Olea europaea var. sylvestris]|uniref:uncharacterized protein LOC111381619 n=1 Tax=Olea europaea var. sylvestris TaxID=158386 RepID=UPI000C1D7387|nr:uncharacterized protein LOC111381619 [Olea europaea var. sylvestris]
MEAEYFIDVGDSGSFDSVMGAYIFLHGHSIESEKMKDHLHPEVWVSYNIISLNLVSKVLYDTLNFFYSSKFKDAFSLLLNRECPAELQEAVASIIFAAPRCSDLPDLLHVRNLFAAKYGKEFISAASELRPDTSVNRTIIEKLSVSAPSSEVKLSTLKEIAAEFNVNWDSSKTEIEFSKKSEDLLNGPKQIAAPPQVYSRLDTREDQPNQEHSTASTNGKQGDRYFQSFTPLVAPSRIEPLIKDHNVKPITETKDTNSDVLLRARTAIAAAERASAAARAAAQLVNLNFSSSKVEKQ